MTNEQPTENNKNTPTQHGRLFKTTFSDLDNARSLFEPMFPPHIRKDVQWPTLEVITTEHIDDNLKLAIPDLVFRVLYQVPGKEPLELTLLPLAEHKSALPNTDDPIELQLLTYIVAEWLYYRKGYKKKESPKGPFRLPIIIPVVVYHGTDKWRTPTLAQLCGADQLDEWFSRLIPSYAYLLHNLNEMTDEQVRQYYANAVSSQLVALVLKHNRDGDEALVNQAESIFQNVVELMKKPDGHAIITSVLNYLGQALENKTSLRYVIRTIERIDQKTGRYAMSAHDQLIAEGKAEGILEGKAEGLSTSKLVFQALKAGHSVEAIAKQYHLSIEEVADLRETYLLITGQS